MNNTIFVYNTKKEPVHSFPAPDDQHLARELWCFLVANLQSGFLVGLAEGEGKIARPSGNKVPVHLYERLLRGDDLDDLTEK